jgi:hypothetical protein
MATILMSGYEMRRKQIAEAIGKQRALSTMDAVADLSSRLDRIDELLVGSIRTGGILRGAGPVLVTKKD